MDLQLPATYEAQMCAYEGTVPVGHGLEAYTALKLCSEPFAPQSCNNFALIPQTALGTVVLGAVSST